MPAGKLEGGVAPQRIEIVGILVPAGDGEDAREQDLGQRAHHPPRITGIGIRAASLWAIPIRRAAAASSITPPSDTRRPLSNLEMTFRPQTAGNGNGGDLPVLSVVEDLAGSMG